MNRFARSVVLRAALPWLLLGACAEDDGPSGPSMDERATDSAVEPHEGDGTASERPERDDAGRDSGSAKDDAASDAPAEDASVLDAASPCDTSCEDDPLRDAAQEGPLRDAAEEDAAAQDASSADAADCGASGIEAADGEHACLHAAHGPFAALELSATAGGAPDASRAHTAFDVTWPGAGAGHGFFRFRAVRTSTHALFSAHAEVIGVTLAETTQRVTRTTETHCASLPSAALVDLVSGETIVVRLARIGAGASQLVIEPLFGGGSSSDACACEDDAGCEPPRDCRADGPCRFDHECCAFCHDGDHCH